MLPVTVANSHLKERIIKTDHLLQTLQDSNKELSTIKSKYKSLLVKFSERSKELKCASEENTRLKQCTNQQEEQLVTSKLDHQLVLQQLEECTEKLRQIECNVDNRQWEEMVAQQRKSPKRGRARDGCDNCAHTNQLKSDLKQLEERNGELEKKLSLLEGNKDSETQVKRLEVELKSLKQLHNADLKKLASLTLENAQLRKTENTRHSSNESKVMELESELTSLKLTFEKKVSSIKERNLRLQDQLDQLQIRNDAINAQLKQIEMEKCALSSNCAAIALQKSILSDTLRNVEAKCDAQADAIYMNEIFGEMIEMPAPISPLSPIVADTDDKPDIIDNVALPQIESIADDLQIATTKCDEICLCCPHNAKTHHFVPVSSNDHFMGFKSVIRATSQQHAAKPWSHDIATLRDDVTHRLDHLIANVNCLIERKLLEACASMPRLASGRHAARKKLKTLTAHASIKTQDNELDLLAEKEIASVDSGYFKSDSEISDVLDDDAATLSQLLPRSFAQDAVHADERKRTIANDDANAGVQRLLQPLEKRPKRVATKLGQLRKTFARHLTAATWKGAETKAEATRLRVQREKVVMRQNGAETKRSGSVKRDERRLTVDVAPLEKRENMTVDVRPLEKVENVTVAKRAPMIDGNTVACDSVVATDVKTFKRPIRRMRVVETPASPTPDDDDDEQIVHEIREIPLERREGLAEDTTKGLFDKLIQYPEETIVFDEVLDGLALASADDIIRSVLDCVAKDVHQKPDTQFTPPAPVMTVTQRVLLAAMSRLEQQQERRAHPDLLVHFLCAAESRILRATAIDAIDALTRLYLAACKLKGQLFRARRLCCDAIYYMGEAAVPFLYVAVTCWGDLVPMDLLPANSFIMKTIIHVLYAKQPTIGSNLANLKNFLSNAYNYKETTTKSDDLLLEFYQEYIETENKELEYALLILCKTQSVEWSFNHIRSLFKPFVEVTTNTRSKINTIRLIGLLGRQFQTSDNSLIDSIEELLNSLEESNSDEEVRESIKWARNVIRIN